MKTPQPVLPLVSLLSVTIFFFRNSFNLLFLKGPLVIENKIDEKNADIKNVQYIKIVYSEKNGNFSYAGINLEVIFSPFHLALS